MVSKSNSPFLYFNFINNGGKVKPLIFTNPEKVIVAQKVSEVIHAMEVIEQAIADGYYAAGYISYEAAPAFNPELNVNSETTMPLLWFGIFKKPVTESKRKSGSFSTKEWKPTVNLKTYNKNIDKIHQYIQEGSTEQVNYTIQMESEFEGDSFAFYKQLEQAQAANYTAFLDIAGLSILSASPELFFRMNNGRITTRPMKGTVRRGNTYEEDIKNAQWLRDSQKNQFENRLIIDVMRNDLEKIAKPGTVEVTKLYEIEKYPTLYQMTSTVEADVAPEHSIVDIFKALFPCGSITGFPKEKTMDIINDLEEDPRNVYCGAIGFITPEKDAIFNVPIRTVTINKETNKANYGVGGAITIDSTKEEEYEEIGTKAELLTKQQPTFELLETLGLFDGSYFLLEHHLKRLEQSASYFDYDVNIKEIKSALINFANEYSDDQWKVRLLVRQNGEFLIDADEMFPSDKKFAVALAREPIVVDDPFLYHKTTNRNMYDIHRNNDVFDVLLWNDNNEVTEFTIGNIVVRVNGEYVTPPVTSGLLAGTFRSKLLEDKTIIERTVFKDDLEQCEEIWLINSVRKWVPVYLQ